MGKLTIKTEKAPEAIGPYSQAVLEDFRYRLELSGQIGIDPSNRKLVEGLEAQTEQVLDNIEGVLSEVGWGFENLTKVRIYLTNINDYPLVNDIYAKRFKDNFPARAAVAVSALPAGALIEIECVAGGNKIPEKYLEETILDERPIPDSTLMA